MRAAAWSLAALAALAVTGCGRGAVPGQAEPAPSEPQTSEVAPSELDETQQRQQQVALAARDALFQGLTARLSEVLSTEGPASAIQVCKVDAPRLAGEVGQQFGVTIGRTSHRLRNPANAPRAWSQALVEQQVTEPKYVALQDGDLGVLLPIRLKPACVLCHGPKDQIAPEVKASLVSHYPDDKATGFKEGDLRGWFWIEVPADAKMPQSRPEVTQDAG